jgi:hypothetical protein
MASGKPLSPVKNGVASVVRYAGAWTVTRGRLAHLLDERQHVLRPPPAVGAYDVGAGVDERLRALGRGLPVPGHRLVLEGHGRHDGQPAPLAELGGQQRLPEVEIGFRDDEVDRR